MEATSERDAKLLADKNFKPVGWSEAAQIIDSGDLTRFRRSPEQIQNYLEAKKYFADHYGGTAQFVLKERLCWDGNLDSASPRFLDSAQDVKVLPNDFPYGFTPDITHVVVWSKVRMATDPATESPAPEAVQTIEEYIDNTLRPLGIPRSDVLWFKNTVSLQSIPTLEHFHLLIRHAPSLDALLGTAGGLAR